MTERTWTTTEAADLARVERRTLTAWLHRGPARASIAPPRGPRHAIGLSLDDVLEICAMARLRGQGTSMRKVRAVVDNLRQLDKRLSDYAMVIVQANSRVVGLEDEQPIPELAERFGQITLLPVREWQAKIARGEPVAPSQAEEQDTRDTGERVSASEQFWSSHFQDCWALLNAAPEEIKELVEADPGRLTFSVPGVLNELLDAFRTLYQFTAAGQQPDERFAQASDTASTFLGQYQPRFDSSGDVTELKIERRPGGREIFAPAGVVPLLWQIVANLAGASPRTIFACEYCERLWPRTPGATHQKFCSDSHRQLAYQQRKGG